MAEWNPNTPAARGLEWFPSVGGGVDVASSADAAAIFLPSTATETIDLAKIYVRARQGRAVYVLDVYELADAVVDDEDVTTATFRPTTDGATVTDAENQAAATTNLYQAVDEATLDHTDYIRGTATGTKRDPFVYTFQVNIGGALAGKRIEEIRVVARGRVVSAGGTATLQAFVEIGGQKHYGRVGAFDTTPGQTYDAPFRVNPDGGLPWTVDDVDEFDDTAGTSEFGIRCRTTAELRITQLYVEIDYFDENRVATASVEIDASGWVSFELETPAGVDNWAKASGTDYLLVAHKISGAGSATFAYLDAGEIGGHEQGAYPVRLAGRPGRVLELGDLQTRSFALSLRTTGPGDSADTQPYVFLLNLEDSAVYTGHSIEQEITAAAATVGFVRFVAAQQSRTAGADLLVKLKRRSDNVQVGDTITVSSADLVAPRTSLRAIGKNLGTPPTLTAQQYYLEFSSTAEDGAGWRLGMPNGRFTEGYAEGAGGTTDVATIDGVDMSSADVAAAIYTQPPAPAGFTATLDTGGSIDSVVLEWTATALGADFAAYLIERSEDAGDTWDLIAEITTEAVEAFTDYEGRRGIEAEYRMRVRRVDGALGVLTATDAATPTATEWALVTNADAALNLVLEVAGEVTYEFPDDVEVHELYDADGAVAIRGLEDRLTIATLPVEFVAPADAGADVFDELLAIARAELPYVCVLDPDGARFFATLIVEGGSDHFVRKLSTTEVVARELTRTPYPVDVELV